MSWIASMSVFLLWTLTWLVAAAKIATRTPANTVQGLRVLLPAYVGSTCLLAFFLLPQGIASVTSLWVHHAATWALFAFLLTAQFLYLVAIFRIRASFPPASIASVFHALRLLTEIAPPPIALLILLTGLRLVWQAAQTDVAAARSSSPVAFWLMCLVLAFGLFFWDGVYSYTAIVRILADRWSLVAAQNASVPPPWPSATVHIGAHFLSWPLVFLLGVYRWQLPSPVASLLSAVAANLDLLPRGWPEVAIALLLWAVPWPVARLLQRSVTRSARRRLLTWQSPQSAC